MAATVAHTTGENPPEGQIRLKMCSNSRRAVGSGYEQVRPADEPGKNDHAPCPDNERLAPDPFHHTLEMAHVRGPDMQQRVGLSGDGASPGDLRMLADGGGDVSGR